MSHNPRLLDQVLDAIRMRHYDCRTEQQHVAWIRRDILFPGTATHWISRVPRLRASPRTLKRMGMKNRVAYDIRPQPAGRLRLILPANVDAFGGADRGAQHLHQGAALRS